MAQALIETRSPKAHRRNSRPVHRGAGEGGRRLAAAFEAVSRLPALSESRRRLLRECERESPSPGEVTAAVESDAALAIAVMRAANNGTGSPGRNPGIPDAIEALTTRGLRAVIATVDTYDPFQSSGNGAERHERFRRHALATRQAAERIAELARLGDREELAVAALLHDVGHLVTAELCGELNPFDEPHISPDERVRAERRELGVDHALVGSVLMRRWGFPAGVASAVERHHSPEAEGHAAAIRLADLIAHYTTGDAAPTEALIQAAARLGLDRECLALLLYESPLGGATRRLVSDPCPLSVREIDALRGLAEGKVYKQIARELSLSVSTVRTHLHHVYRKIGVVDRAQAVLIARDRGWI
jgi:putative nucleotidyltransferase with HDIG domain